MKPVPGSPFATPNAWDVAHAGSLVFVTSTNLTDTTNNALYVYRSDATTGTLTLLKTITQPTGPTNVPVNVFADPSGQNLYISSASDAVLIYGFAIDQASGNLAPLPGSPYASFDTGNRGWMYNAQFTPDGKLLFGIECPYAGGRFCSTYIVSMQRDPSTGVLTRPANNAARNDFNAMAIAGNYVIGTWWSSYIHVYSYDASGVLTEVSGSPTTPENSTTQESCAVAWQSGTNRVYIGSANGSGGPTNPGAITAYALDSSGKLSPISGASRSTGGVNTTCSLEFTPSGFLTFTTASGLEGYSVNSDATLTPLAGSPQPAGSKPRAQTSLHSSTGQ